MSRKLKEGVILGMCELMKETEVPELFSLWGGISLVSSVLGRSVYIDQGHFVVYPNLYVILTAGSAKCRKSTVINMVEKLLRRVDPPIHLMSQKSTPEALIQDMCSIITASSMPASITPATGSIIADEISTFIDKNAFQSGMIAVLTKLYDCQDFDYRTRSRGQELVKDPCLSILGGSTIQWIKESIPVVSIGGGFTARIIFVFQDRRYKDVPWPKRTEATEKLKEDIIDDLSDIKANMMGRFAVTQKAIDMYSDEYTAFGSSPLFEDPNMAGYAGRRHVMVLKLAMCFSASNDNSKEVNDTDMARAINSLKMAEKDMQRVLSAISSEPCGDLSEQLVVLIRNRETVSRSDIVRHFRHKLTVAQLEEVLRTLAEAKYIQLLSESGTVYYRWIAKR